METEMSNWHNGMPLYRKIGLKNDTQLRAHLISLYRQGKGQPTIAKELGVHLQTIYRTFKRLKIDTRNFSDGNLIRLKRYAKLNKLQQEILSGLLLGDGHINMRSRMASYIQSCKHQLVLEEIAGQFAQLDCKITKRSDKPGFNLKTLTYLDLVDTWKLWYKQRKIVPDLKLTPIICYWWFIGDGSAGKSELKLSTDGFQRAEVEALRTKLAKVLNLSVTTIRLQNPRQDQWVLVLKSLAADEFLKYIGSCHTPCYAYKWDRRRHSKGHNTEPISEFCKC